MNERLLLARLLAAGPSGATERAVHKDLDSIVARSTSAREAAAVVSRSLDEATAKGLVRQEANKRSTKVFLTEAGTKRAQKEFPGSQGKTWAGLKKTWLVVHALGLASEIDPSKVSELSKLTTLRLVLIRQHFGLELPVVPSAKALDTALAWHAMRQGITDAVHRWAKQRAVTVDVMLSALVASAGDVAPAPKKREVYARLAAKLAGARNAKDLHDALVARLAAAPDPASSLDESHATGSPGFAAEVLAAAGHSPTGKLGASLVLINHAHRQYVREHPENALPLDAFKEQLWTAARAGELVLASADMPQTLDPGDYRDSRIDRGASIFALIRI